MRLPVSISAVAMMVSEPASSVLRAAAKILRGISRARASMPPVHGASAAAHGVIEGAAYAGDGVEKDEDVFAGLHEALGALDGELGDARVALDVAVIRAGHDFRGRHGALDFGDFLGAFIDQEDDQFDVLVIFHHRIRDVLEQRRLAGAGRGDNEAALALANGGQHIDDARGIAFRKGLHPETAPGADDGEFVERSADAALSRARLR